MRFDPSIVTVKQSSIVRSKKYLTLKENGDQILLKIILRNFKTRQRPDVLGQIDVLLTLKSMLKQSLRDRGGEGRAKEKERGNSVLWRDVEVPNTKDTLRLCAALFNVR